MVAVLAALALAGCDGATEPDWSVFIEGANEAQAQWLDEGPANYVITQVRHCVCSADERGPVRITVTRSGSTETISSMVYVDGDLPVPPIYQEHFHSVTGLFEVIREAARARVPGLQITYDSNLGYPRRIVIDRQANIVEDDVIYEVSALDPL